MTRQRLPLVGLAMVALIGVIGAGCGSNGHSETGSANNDVAATNTGTASSTGSASDKRATDRDKAATQSSARLSRAAGAPPSPPGAPGSAGLPSRSGSSSSPGRLPTARSRRGATIGALSPEPNSTQSPHDWRRHE
jgi:hypothetical protein